MDLIRNILQINCYPLEFINKHIHIRLNSLLAQTDGLHMEGSELDFDKMVNFPYVERTYHQMYRLMKEYGLFMVTNNKHNISLVTGSTKDKIEPSRKSNLVYSIPCSSCDSVYIGQTRRYLSERVKEHKRGLKTIQKNPTALTAHHMDASHGFDFEKVKILNYESNLRKRLILEMIQIKKHNSVNFRTDIEKFSAMYNSVL